MSAIELWKKLAKIYLDSEDRLESDFEHFPKGTHVQSVYNWLRTNFPEFDIVGHSWKETMEKYGA